MGLGAPDVPAAVAALRARGVEFVESSGLHTATSTTSAMDTISLAGSLENKLEAMREAGFSQVMLKANDIVGHDGDDYQQMPLTLVAQRARASALWLSEDVLRRSVPLPNRMRLKAAAP